MDGRRTRDLLTSELPNEFIELRAEELDVVERDRKLDVVALFWTLILGWPAAAERTLASLRRAYIGAAGHCIARSSFYDRLSAELLALMKSCLEGLLDGVRQRTSSYHGAVLRHFEDVLAIDSTIVRLHKMLRDVYPGCSDGVASAKLDIVMNVAEASPRRVQIAEGKQSDQAFWKRLGPWVEDKLLLFDLGYYQFNFFRRIDRHGGRFISRLKDGANPCIVANHLSCRGRAIGLVGRKLQDVLDRLRRKRLDLTVEIDVQKRRYRGTRSTETCQFRIVGQHNDETGEYHLYITNIDRDVLEVDDIAETYTLRWQIELLMKQLRSHARLDELPTEKEHVAKILIYASILALLVSRAFLRELRQNAPGAFYPAHRFQAVFEAYARPALQAVTACRRDESVSIFDCIAREARDPNLIRERGMDAMYNL